MNNREGSDIDKDIRHNGNGEYDKTSTKKRFLKMHSFHGLK